MKDYSGMNDGGINMLVGESLGLIIYILNQDESVQFRNEKGHIKGTKDYCNNPADAWPIIVGSNISLLAPRFNEGWLAEFTGSDDDVNDGFDVDYFDSHNTNPLRAAMEVFLMIKGAEKGHG